MTNAINAFGTLLKIGDGGSPETFVTIAELTDIDGPELEMDTLEATNHSSPGGFREYVGGLLDAGEISIEFNFLPTDATQGYSTGLLHDMVNRTKRNFQFVFSGGITTWSFAALVTKFKSSEPIDDLLKGSATLKITGQPTLA